MQRTDWAEIFAEHFLQAPLTAECVFRSPRYLPADKELCDHMLLLRNDGVIVSMKCQEDPTVRSGDKLERWAAKSARAAARQAKVAIQRLRKAATCCEHPRRGRVDFEANQISVSHAIVVAETFEPVELPDDLPLDHCGVPFTYMSVNDFLNMIDQLRAHPDIKKYLSARRILPAPALQTIGAEVPLYEYYLLNEESFVGCLGMQHASEFVASRQNEIKDALRRKSEADKSAYLIEYVTDTLARRHSEYRSGLDAETLAMFDDPNRRTNYLMLQESLCDLPLSDRRMLGRQFEAIIQRVKENTDLESLSFAAGWTDTKPDFVYVFVSSRGVVRAEVIRKSQALLLGALAHYGKNAGMFITDRDGVSYEVGLFRNVPVTREMQEFGGKYFGHLKMTDHLSKLVPDLEAI